MQIPAPKGRTVTAKFYKNVVLRKLKKYYKTRRPKTGLERLRLLQDNAPAHKAHLVTEFLESEMVTVLPHPQFLPDLPSPTPTHPPRLFSVSKIQISSIWEDIQKKQMPLDLLFISI